ncbi:G-type lectin S-receptor-like serine/threonine-protein kinase LECRK3 [Arachis stenosperma]|uniref:G-type lectin S-receptor-like serine/threonine-protein kinase LECRK3 n=1 Tax=Arachis stenosperma TaxID=217475 RepID=UPI0025AC3005|nr:G-type lectin S-receptor-like serine/threonine-protein kinase LECRK3 [Arachis stenosperma]
MASKSPILIVLLFLSSILLLHSSLADADDGITKIELGHSLSPKGNQSSSWLSSSGHFAFGFYPHAQGYGYAVGIWLLGEPDITLVWTANRNDPPLPSSSTLLLTIDGLVLQQGQKITNNVTGASMASMLDSGNFVIYDDSHVVVWQSFDHPTDTILGGQNLTAANRLVSSLSKTDHSTGLFYLIMQESDSNLVAYPLKTLPYAEDHYWAEIDNATTGSVQLSLNTEGFLCLREHQCFVNNTNLLRNSNSQKQNTTSIYRATFDFDGVFRLYEHQFDGEGNRRPLSVEIRWEALHDKCQINGFCGFNSYCSNTNMCHCYPGFVPISSNGMFLECKLNYSKDECQSNPDPSSLYDVTLLEHMSWSDFPYLVTKETTMEACEESCKEDCDCGGALYANNGGICSIYRLPLRYGRKVPNASDTATAIFKVPYHSGFLINQTHLDPDSHVVVDNKRSLILILSSSLGSVTLLCVIIAVSVFFNYRHHVYSYAKLSASSNLGFTKECSLRSFSFDELLEATSGFTEEIGRGSYGAVYKGTVTGDGSNKSVAVKRLERIADDEGEREFRAEVTAIARTHHRNLVKLVGYCIEGSRKLLVYEYVSNGCLANLLFKGKNHHHHHHDQALPWKERIKIALDVARGVQYLHEECGVRIVHCNLKPQNILIDEAWTAKISDFGLARLLKQPQQPEFLTDDEVRSSYLAPEWKNEASPSLSSCSSPLVSVKVDIYSYGVVVLEIVCRRRSIDVNVKCPEEVLLSSWVYQCYAEGELRKLVVNESEEEDTDWKTLERMVKVGLWCVQDDPSLRPSMKNVILMLEGWKPIPTPPSPLAST